MTAQMLFSMIFPKKTRTLMPLRKSYLFHEEENAASLYCKNIYNL